MRQRAATRDTYEDTPALCKVLRQLCLPLGDIRASLLVETESTGRQLRPGFGCEVGETDVQLAKRLGTARPFPFHPWLNLRDGLKARIVSIFLQSSRSLPSRWFLTASKSAVTRQRRLEECTVVRYCIPRMTESSWHHRIGRTGEEEGETAYTWTTAPTRGVIKDREPGRFMPNAPARATPAAASNRLEMQLKKVTTCLRQCCSPSVNLASVVSAAKRMMKRLVLTTRPSAPCLAGSFVSMTGQQNTGMLRVRGEGRTERKPTNARHVSESVCMATSNIADVATLPASTNWRSEWRTKSEPEWHGPA